MHELCEHIPYDAEMWKTLNAIDMKCIGKRIECVVVVVEGISDACCF